MDGPPVSEVTRILSAVAADEEGATRRLLPIVYDELRRLAAGQMAAERSGHTLQATALVHEAYIRLVGSEDPSWENRAHFFAAAGEAMRRILIEHARARRRRKRGGELQRLELDEGDGALEHDPADLLALDEALSHLEERDERLARLVKLRYFAGLTVEQTAASLGVTVRTVHREWATARAWLRAQMGRIDRDDD